MTYTRLNPKYIGDTSSSPSQVGVTFTAKSGFTVTVTNAKQYGNVVSGRLEIKSSSAITARSGFSPFSTNAKYMILSSVYLTGGVSSSANAWVYTFENISANIAYDAMFIAII